MIYGIGTDIVEIKRIEDALEKHGERFPARILNTFEIAEYATQASPMHYLAKRFAVKEAFSKAFGTGIGESIGWHDVWITHVQNGRPIIAVSATLEAKLTAQQIIATHVSITDETSYASAFVVLETK
jgi:holo-[acyl-carrier protein] synthase